MAKLVIVGNTLGEIHHNYNNIVNDAIKNKNVEITEINYDDSDLDNLFKIDIASKSRDVEYILKVLQCTDMLYVSRAIKKSPWLITDKQYAHVINPEYLFNELSPQMTSKAFNKLILQIRLLLRDEERVEDFYNYNKDLRTALKWLPHCSKPFIEKILEKHSNDNEVKKHLIKRLCERSIDFLEIYCRHHQQYYKREVLFETMFVLKSDVERYLRIIETMDYDKRPTFTAKYTKIIMTKCRDRIMDNLSIYAGIIHIPTFVKFIPAEDMTDFILINIKKKILPSWLGNLKIKYFINRIPSDIRFEFTTKIFIDKEHETDGSYDNLVLKNAVPYKSMEIGHGWKDSETCENIYTWYIFAPFQTAFTDLTKLIRTVLNPNERNAILTVLLTTAGNDMQNIHTLLKYYREYHINEAFNVKIKFIDILLSETQIYNYDKDTWKYLKDIFFSMEVYSESDKNVQSCVRSVLLYSLINDEAVPEIIEKKFEFDTLKQYNINLSQDEQNKIFNYLFNFICSKIQTDKSQNEKEFQETFGILKNTLNLLCDWDKDLKDYPAILGKFKQIIEINNGNSAWNLAIRRLCSTKKSWQKLLFSDFLLISPAKDAIMNVLKHDPILIERNKHKIVELLKVNKRLLIFLRKIRIYWSQSLANSFKELLLNNLHQNYTHKFLIAGLCTLLPRNEMMEVIKKYVPSEFKINWNQQVKVQLCIRKYLAMNLYLARPQPSLDIFLLYAKGDYLQYALPSLIAILYNTINADFCENLKTLLNSPVSLQKHGIRAAILKLNPEDHKQILSDIWKSTENGSIRSDIFLYNHNILCHEKKEKSIKDRWALIKIFIDNLTPNEDKQIYETLSRVEDVPRCIRGEYWLKSYEFLNSLPAKANCGSLIAGLAKYRINIIPLLDVDFVANIFTTLTEKKYRCDERMRAEIFQYYHNMLCEEKNEKIIKERWEFMKLIIDNLTLDEFSQIYHTLFKVYLVPMCVRVEYWMKCYNFFNSLPEDFECKSYYKYHFFYCMPSIMQFLDEDFIINIFGKSFEKNFCVNDFTHAYHVAVFLLSAKTEEAQMKRYKKCLVPMFEKSFPVWDKQHEGVYHVRNNMFKIIKNISEEFMIVVNDNMVLPVKMFTEILETLQKEIPETENYILLTMLELGLNYITIIDKVLREEKEMDSESSITMSNNDFVRIQEIITPIFAKACVEHLKREVAYKFSSIYVHFATALSNVFKCYDTNYESNILKAFYIFIEDKEFIEGYLLVLNIIWRLNLCDEKYKKENAMRMDLYNKIGKHPNEEIKINYWFCMDG